MNSSRLGTLAYARKLVLLERREQRAKQLRCQRWGWGDADVGSCPVSDRWTSAFARVREEATGRYGEQERCDGANTMWVTGSSLRTDSGRGKAKDRGFCVRTEMKQCQNKEVKLKVI